MSLSALISPLVILSAFGEPYAANTCGAGEHWVQGHSRRAYYRSDGTFVSATSVTPHCRQNSIGYETWNPRIKEGRPEVWGYKNEKTGKWTIEERERLLEAVSELPEALRELAIEGLHRMRRSTFGENPATSNRGDIVLYDSAFASKHVLSRVMAHELSHQLYETLSKGEINSYRLENGWRKDARQRWSTTRSSRQFVQADGQESPHEDFANNIEYFIYAPQELLKRTPSAYHWIEKCFGSRLKIKPGKAK